MLDIVSMSDTFIPYPLLFEPALFEKVWGGSAIQTLKQGHNSRELIGESWEIFWKNRIVNGEYAGASLGELIARYTLEMTGSLQSSQEFPLLVKLLDAHEWLSVQVHPDDILADVLEGQPRGKTECWYIIQADLGAQIVYGLKSGTTKQEYQYALNHGSDKDLLNIVAVQTGDFIFVPAGTIHAIGPGILLYELQQTSDTTYRLSDWDRVGLDGKLRELHIEKGLISMIEPASNIVVIDGISTDLNSGITMKQLISSEYFSLKHYTLEHNAFNVSMNQKAGLLTVIGNTPISLSGGFDTIIVHPGYTTFLPACLETLTIVSDTALSTEFLFAQENY